MANALQELVLRIGGDSSGGQQAVRDLSSALANTLTKALQDTGQKAEESSRKVSGFQRYLDDLKPSTDNAHASFTSLHTTLVEMWENPTAGVKKFAGAVGTDLSGALASAGGALGTTALVTGGVAAAFAVAGAAAFELAKRSAETGAKLDDLHDATGMSVEALSRLSNAAQVLGVDVKSLSDLVFKMQQRMGENPEEFAKGLERIGLEFEDFKRLAPEEQLNALSTALQKTTDYAERNAAGTALMGKGFRDLAPTLYDLNKALDLTKDITPWTAEQAGLAEDFDMHLKSIGVHFDAIAVSLGRMATPPVLALLDLLVKWAGRESARLQVPVATLLGPEAVGLKSPSQGQSIQYGGSTVYLPNAPSSPGGYYANLFGANTSGSLTNAPRPGFDPSIVGTSEKELEKIEEEQQRERLKRIEELKKAKADALKAELDDEQKAQDIALDTEIRLHEQVMRLSAKQAEADKKAREEIQKERNKAIVDSLADIEKMQHAQEDADLSVADAQVRAIERRRDAQLRDVQNSLLLEGRVKDERIRLIQETADREIAIIRYAQESISDMLVRIAAEADRAPAAVRHLSQEVDGLAQAFYRLGQMADGGFGLVLSGIGQGLSLFSQYQSVVEKYGASSPEAGQARSAMGYGMAGVGLGLVSQSINGGAGASTGSLIAKYGTQGASIGSIGGPYGMLIGGGVGAAYGWYESGKEWRKAFSDVERDFGKLHIPEDFAKTIEEIESTTGLQRTQALTTQLGKLIEIAGGLKPDNFELFFQKLHDAFSYVEQGTMTVAQVTQVLDSTFADFARVGTDAYGRINDQVRELIDLDQRFGTHSQAIADWMKGQAATMAAGLNDLLAQPMITSGAVVKKAVDDAQKALDDLKASGKATADELTKAQDALTEALSTQHHEAVRNKQALDDLGTTALLAFNAAVASGQTFAQALQSIGPQLSTIQQAYKDLGLEIDDAALKGLTLQNTILNGPGGTGKAIGGLQAIFTAATNMGVMTPEAFAAQQRQLHSVYTQTQAATAAAGGTTINALQPFQQVLHQMEEWAKKNGQALDEETQEKIRQSKELGIWNDDFKTDSEKTRDSMAELIKSLDALAAQLGGMPATNNPTGQTGSGYWRPGPGGAPDWTPSPEVQFATEAYVRRPTMAMVGDVAGGEFVLKPSTVARWMGAAYGQGTTDTGAAVYKNYTVSVAAKDPAGEEQWLREWMRRDGVKITVDEIEDGRYVSRLRRKIAPEIFT